MTPNKPTRRRRLAKALIIAAIIFGTLMMLLATLLIMFPYESRHSDGTTLPHHQRNPEAKAHMLALINSLRTSPRLTPRGPVQERLRAAPRGLHAPRLHHLPLGHRRAQALHAPFPGRRPPPERRERLFRQ